MSESVAAVVITFNRLELLKEVLSAIKNQSRKPDKIILVNNSSTDGTYEWLSEQKDILLITQENLGSSGGQFTGLKVAYELGYDWIWTMDDDVVPDFNCLENLLNSDSKYKIRTPLRFDSNNQPYFNDAVSYNFTNPVRSLWVELINEEILKRDFIEAVGITFEGPLIHRSVIEKIGLPNKKFFIFADDTEFFVRANRVGFRSIIVTSSKLYRKIDLPDDIYKFTWKTFYIIRNLIWLDRIFGSFFVKYIRPFGYLIIWLLRSKSLSDIRTVFKAFKSGYFDSYI
jgi:GT2 family glycosyltransferase